MRVVWSLLFISALISSNALATMPGELMPKPGMEFAPPCRFSYDRGHSVDAAAERMIHAGRLFHENGERPLQGSALADADAALSAAYYNLLTVINDYYALYRECVVCNPDASLGNPPWGWPSGEPYTLRTAIVQLGNLEKLIRGDPARNEFGSLARTLYEIRPWEPYCAVSSDAKDVLDLAVSPWEFGVYFPDNVLTGTSGNFTLTTDVLVFTSVKASLGRKLQAGTGDRNQSYYWLVDGELVFLDAEGDITSRFWPKDPDLWEGWFTVIPNSSFGSSLGTDGSLRVEPWRIDTYISRLTGPPPPPGGYSPITGGGSTSTGGSGSLGSSGGASGGGGIGVVVPPIGAPPNATPFNDGSGRSCYCPAGSGPTSDITIGWVCNDGRVNVAPICN